MSMKHTLDFEPGCWFVAEYGPAENASAPEYVDAPPILQCVALTPGNNVKIQCKQFIIHFNPMQLK